MNTYIRAAGKKKEKERTRERGKKEKEGVKVLIYNIRGKRAQDIGQTMPFCLIQDQTNNLIQNDTRNFKTFWTSLVRAMCCGREPAN